MFTVLKFYLFGRYLRNFIFFSSKQLFQALRKIICGEICPKRDFHFINVHYLFITLKEIHITRKVNFSPNIKNKLYKLDKVSKNLNFFKINIELLKYFFI